MQNKNLSILSILFLSSTILAHPVFAETNVSASQVPAIENEVKSETPVSTEVKSDKEPSVQNADSVEEASVEEDFESEKHASSDEAQTTVNVQNQDQLKINNSNVQTSTNKPALGNSVSINQEQIVDFPVRSSLGSIEMATLPGLNESLITGPAPMGESLSSKDLPSEQLLGRITTEVFQEMADLERGNVFLKLQMQKEQLKNDLENLKAKYRQARLEEIAKREDVVRSRINWWQEQENIRLEMDKKRAETEVIEQQIAEAEELRKKLRSEAMNERTVAEVPVVESDPQNADTTPVSSIDSETKQSETQRIVQPASQLYSLIGVRGLKGRLSARIRDLEDQRILTVKKGEKLRSGHKIVKIEKDSIQLSYAGRLEIVLLSTPTVDTSTN